MLATSACAVTTENSSTIAAIPLQQTSPFNAASPVQLPRRIESRSLHQKGCGISWINKGQKFGKLITATTFYFSFKSAAAKRLRFDLKEKQCLKLEHGVRGHLNKSVR